jgi:hypothetical protein
MKQIEPETPRTTEPGAAHTMTPDQVAELQRLKSYLPFRIVCGALNPATGEFVTIAKPTMRAANDYARKGWKVWRLN